MAKLQQVIEECEDRLVEQWLSGFPEESEVRRFLDELKSSLRDMANRVDLSPDARELKTLEEVAPGGDALALHRALERLYRHILRLAGERGVDLSPREHFLLSSKIHAAMASAFLDYVLKRNDKTHQFAHALRNPLGSVVMSLNLLRSRAALGDGARLFDTAGRNLKRIETLIDSEVEETAKHLPPSPPKE